MKRQNHFIAQLISFLMSIVLLCGVLPVRVCAETVELTVSETLIYMAPGETRTISYSLEGGEAALGVSYVDSEWYDGSLPEVNAAEGVITIALPENAYGWAMYELQAGDASAGFRINVGEPAESIYMQKSEGAVAPLKQGTYSLGYYMEPHSANFGAVELLSENPDIAVPVNGSRKEFELVSTGQTRIGVRSGNLEQWIDLEVVDGEYVTAIELKDGKSEYEMNIGDSIPSPFVINPDGSSYADDVITYESDNESIASVDEDGTIHALQAGRVSIWASNSLQSVRECVYINVKSDVTGIRFDAESYTVTSRKKYLELSEHLITEPEDAKNHTFLWTTSDPDVVNIDSRGHIYYVNQGTATMRVEDMMNSEIYAECQVNAVKAEDISFKLLSPQPLLLERGDRYEVLYELTGTDEEPVFSMFWTDASVTMEGNFICVDENSRLAGFEIDVFVEDTWVGEIRGSVVAYPKSIALNIPKTYHLSEQEVSVSYRLDPYDAYISSEPLCSSSDPSVASFDNPDNPTVLSLKKAGKTVISIDSDNGLHDEKEITVIDYDYAVSAVWKDEQETHYVLKGETMEVPLVLKPEGHQFVDDEITYRSSDETVITVDENGVLKGMNCGSARITAYGRMGRLGDVKVNVYEKPEHISFRKNEYMLTDGMSLIEGMDQIVFEPAGARYGEYRFTSSKEDAVVVGETGQISYRGNGTAVIRVESVSEPSVFAECTVNTTNESKPLEKVELPDVTGYVGADLLIRINVIPEEAVRYDLFNYHCEADNDNVRLYEDDYWKAGYYGRMIRLSCLKPGTTEIKVINTNEGGFTATCKVTIVDGKTDWKETYSIGRSDADRELDFVTEPDEYVFYLGEEYHLKREFKSAQHDGYFMMPTDYDTTLKPLLEETGLFADIYQQGGAIDGRGESKAVFRAAKAGTAVIEPVSGKKVKVTVVDKAVLEPEVKGNPALAEALKKDSTLGIDFDEELKEITIPEDIQISEDEKIAVQTYMDINVREAEDTKLVIDITPMYQIVVMNENAPAGSAGTIVSEPKELEISRPVNMEIPVRDLFPDGTQVYIQHRKENGTVYSYTGTVENGMVKFKNPDGFSQFTITAENLSKILIGNVVYETLQDAVENVKDGETITVNTDEPLEASVSREITFTIENNAHVTVKAGRGYKVEQNGTVYTVTTRTPLVKTEAKAPTCTEDGNKEYWTDPETGRYYADEDGTEEIAKDSWILKATGHKYGTPTYTWNKDKVTAKAVCEHDSTHVITETVTATNKVTTEPTCEKDGVRTYTTAFKNSMFKTQTKTEAIPAIGHQYGTPVYTWSSDNKTVTATVTCTNDKSHKITETVNTTYKVTKEATETAEGTGTYTASFKNTLFTTQTKTVMIPKKAPAVKTVEMYRLYNPNSGEHFYTAKAKERDVLASIGWQYEGIGWYAPAESKTPVYRLYNENAGDHHYTKNKAERDALIKVGWKDEKIGWYSDDNEEVPLYRQYNPNAVSGSHNYTTNKKENDALVKIGWIAEGIGWYGVKN